MRCVVPVALRHAGVWGSTARRPACTASSGVHRAPGSAAADGCKQSRLRKSRASFQGRSESRQTPEAVDFDLGLAVALAGVAFESYLEPTGAEGYQEVSLNGCKTTYTDRSFLASTYDGILHVRLHGAENLAAADMNGKSDPYAVLSIGDSTGKSKVIFAELNPVWDDSFFLYVRSKEDDMLKVRVYDKDLLTSDDDLGLAMRGLADLERGHPLRLQLPLRGPSAKGFVDMSLEFLAFTDETGVADLVTAEGTDLPTVTATEMVVAEGLSAAASVTAEVASSATSLAASVVQGSAESTAPMVEAAGESMARLKQQLEDASKQLEEVAGGAEGLRAAAQHAAARKLQKLVGDLSLAGTFAAASENLRAIVQDLDRATQQVEVPSAVRETLDSSAQRGVAIMEQLKGALQPLMEAAMSSAGETEGDGNSDADQSATARLAPEELPAAWKVLAKVAGKQMEDHYVPVAYIENLDTDTQVWLYHNPTAREAVVAFRGTEQVKWKDFVTDLNLTPAAFNPERVDSNAGLPWMARALQLRKAEAMVHSGFLGAYDSVRARVQRLLETIMDGDRSGPWRVMVTGHSLGGALATICSYELSTYFATAGQPHRLTVYTYGAPRVGNAAFATAFNAAVHDSWRVTNWNDIIPTVPRLMGYCHVRHGARLQPDGALQIETDPRDIFGEGKHAEEVVSELVQRVQAGTTDWEEVAEEIRANEIQMLEGLIAGRAIEEHLETFYLLSLQQMVLAAVPEASTALDNELEQQATDDKLQL